MLHGVISEEFRGRVMSLFAFQFIALTPAGQVVLGAIGTPLGIHAAFIAAGAVCFVVGIFGIIRVHEVRNWRGTHEPIVAEEEAAAMAANVTIPEATAAG
jgi:hypothetical protein